VFGRKIVGVCNSNPLSGVTRATAACCESTACCNIDAGLGGLAGTPCQVSRVSTCVTTKATIDVETSLGDPYTGPHTVTYFPLDLCEGPTLRQGFLKAYEVLENRRALNNNVYSVYVENDKMYRRGPLIFARHVDTSLDDWAVSSGTGNELADGDTFSQVFSSQELQDGIVIILVPSDQSD